jgi:sugar O-acyltransferase (sialic acid O-acetyltransferase NeuD family)
MAGKKSLVIVGAGGFGREVFEWAAQSFDFAEEWCFKGFVDDNPNALAGKNYPVGILCGIDAYEPEPRDYFLCAVGKPGLKADLVGQMLEKGAKPASLIHPTVVIGRNVRLGRGVILCPRVVLTCDIHLGDFVTFNVASAAGHDVEVGDWSQTSAFCDLTGNTRLGKGVFMGSHSTVLPGISVGDHAVVGAGSVVVRDVPAGETVFGAPAVRLRTR